MILFFALVYISILTIDVVDGVRAYGYMAAPVVLAVVLRLRS